MLEHGANNEILEKVGGPPPSYNDVVVNRATIPEHRAHISEKEMMGEKVGAVDSDAESLNDVADGFQNPQLQQHAAPQIGGPEYRQMPAGQY